MICKNCSTENITKACYCKNCGSPFTDRDRKAAYDATVYGKIDKLSAAWQKFKSITNLSIVTGNRYVKYGTLAVIIIWGLLAGRAHGNSMTILDSDEYAVQYNKSAGEYYVISQSDSVTLNFYLPQQADSIYIREYSENGNYHNSRTYSPDDSIVLKSAQDIFYSVTANYSDAGETIKLFVLEQ